MDTANIVEKKIKEILTLDEAFWHCYGSLRLLSDGKTQDEERGSRSNRIINWRYIDRRYSLLIKKAKKCTTNDKRQMAFESRFQSRSERIKSYKSCSNSTAHYPCPYWQARKTLLQRKCERRKAALENRAIAQRVESSLMAAVLAQEAEDQVYRETAPPPENPGLGDRAMIESMLKKTDLKAVGTPHFRHALHMESAVEVVCFAHGARRMFIAGLADGRIVLYNYNLEASIPPKKIANPQAHQGPITSADWSLDNSTVITSSKDKTMRIWSINHETEDEPVQLQSIAYLESAPVSASFCSIYSDLAFVAQGSNLTVMNLEDPPVVMQKFKQDAEITSMVISENYTELFLALLDGQILMCALEEDPECFRQNPIMDSFQGKFAFGAAAERAKQEETAIDSPPTSPRLLASVKRTWTKLRPAALFPGEGIHAVQLVFRKFDYHLGHPTLFVVDNATSLWRIKVETTPDQTLISLLDSWLAPAESTGITALGSYPHSEAIACGTADKRLKIFQPKVSTQGKQEHKATFEVKGHHSAAISQVLLNADGTFMVSADINGDIVLWRLKVT